MQIKEEVARALGNLDYHSIFSKHNFHAFIISWDGTNEGIEFSEYLCDIIPTKETRKSHEEIFAETKLDFGLNPKLYAYWVPWLDQKCPEEKSKKEILEFISAFNSGWHAHKDRTR